MDPAGAVEWHEVEGFRVSYDARVGASRFVVVRDRPTRQLVVQGLIDDMPGGARAILDRNPSRELGLSLADLERLARALDGMVELWRAMQARLAANARAGGSRPMTTPPTTTIKPAGDWLNDKRAACLAATTQADADRCFADLVDAHVELDAAALGNLTRDQIEWRVREALGYVAGYHSNETRARVERLYRCAHPIFGPIAECGVPTPEQALRVGQAIGEADSAAEVERVIAELQAEMRAQHAAVRATAGADDDA